MQSLKRFSSYLLIGIIMIITFVALLGIWDIIDLEDVLRKIITSLFVIFVASVVVLFIFSVLIKDDGPSPKEKNE